VFEEVARLAGRTLCEVVQEYFPCLRPRVEINTMRPECWNKDGHADSLKRWIEEPAYAYPPNTKPPTPADSPTSIGADLGLQENTPLVIASSFPPSSEMTAAD
jgi:hypothetical protein